MEKRVTIRLSQEDFTSLEEEAGRAGATLAEALREGWRRGHQAASLEERLAKMEQRLADRLDPLAQVAQADQLLKLAQGVDTNLQAVARALQAIPAQVWEQRRQEQRAQQAGGKK